jgi:hypothetical protein
MDGRQKVHSRFPLFKSSLFLIRLTRQASITPARNVGEKCYTIV